MERFESTATWTATSVTELLLVASSAKMNAFILSLLIALLVSSATAFRVAPKASLFVGRPTKTFRLAMADETKYEIVPVEPETVQSAAAVTGGIVGFVLAGPVGALVLAAISNFVTKKDSDSGEALRGFGKTVIEAYNFLNKINAKYQVTDKVGAAITETVSSVAKDSDAIETIKKTYTETISKVEEINTEFDLVSKGTEAVKAAGELSDQAIEKIVELNEKVKALFISACIIMAHR